MPAGAVILSVGDGTGNADLLTTDATRHVGTLNSASGTYLGEGWVLTANHVGPGDISLGTATYTFVPGTAIRLETSAGQYADLLMFQVFPSPPLEKIPIRTIPPLVGDPVLMVGNGKDRGAPITFDPFGPEIDPPEQTGWQWAATRSLRWGLNNVESINPLPILGTTVFLTRFDDIGPIVFEAQAANGDSGGGVYTYDPLTGVELAGIMISVSLHFGQDSTSSLFLNETIIASLDVYADQIEQNIINAPEPSGGIFAGLVMLALIAQTKRLHSNRENG